MPNDIETMVDEFLDEADTLVFEKPEVWTVIGADADGDPGDLEAVLEALESAEPTDVYEQLMKDLGE